MKMYVYTNTSYMNIPYSFIYKAENDSNIHQTGEWINKFWYIHTMEYYLAIKQKKPKNYGDIQWDSVLSVSRGILDEFQPHCAEQKVQEPDTEYSI